MDLATILWLDSDPEDSYWESSYRRSDSEGHEYRGIFDVPADFDDNEDAWNDQRRRERLAEAEYDC